MKSIYKILRAFFVLVLSSAIAVPAVLYILLSLPSVQNGICHRVESELSKLLAVNVDIRHVSISPFNRVTLHGVTAYDAVSRDTMLTVERLGTGISINGLIHRRIVLNYAEVIGLNAKIKRVDPEAPLNIQPIIDALKPKDKNKPPTKFDFRINTVVVRTSAVSYDVLSEEETPGRFNTSHIAISDMKADVRLPRMANDDFTIDLRRLALMDKSGLALKSLSGLFHIAATELTAEDVVVELPSSKVMLNNQRMTYSSLSELSKEWKTADLNVEILEGSYLSTGDFVPLVPKLSEVNLTANIMAQAEGTVTDLEIPKVEVEVPELLSLKISDAAIEGLTCGAENIRFDVPELAVATDGGDVIDIVRPFATIDAKASKILSNLGYVTLEAGVSGSLSDAIVHADIESVPGRCLLDLNMKHRNGGGVALKGDVVAESIDGAALMAGTSKGLEAIGMLDALASMDMVLGKGLPQGHVELDVPQLTYRGYEYSDISLQADIEDKICKGNLAINSSDVKLGLDVVADLSPEDRSLDFSIDATDVDLAALNLVKDLSGRRLSVKGDGMLYGLNIDDLNGYVGFHDINYVDAEGKGLHFDTFTAEAVSSENGNELHLRSDIVDGNIVGRYSYTRVPRVARALLSEVLPNLVGEASEADMNLLAADAPDEYLRFDLHLKDSKPIEQLVKLPVSVIYPVDVTGGISNHSRNITLNVDAPYIQQGNKLIENTSLRMGLNGATDGGYGKANMYFTTLVPTKKGNMTLMATAFGSDGHLDTQLSWHVARARQFNGNVNLTASFARDEERNLVTNIGINPGSVVMNDTIWQISPAKVSIEGKRVAVDGFKVGRPGQYIMTEGVVSDSEDDYLTLSLRDVNLDYIFETLDISNAMFGGNATGDFYVSSVFSPHPIAYTPALEVKGMKYNFSLLGDARIVSSWDDVARSVDIDAVITQPNGRKSTVSGNILPMADSLDFHFQADRIEVGFLKPFMVAFADGISGYASGNARLWGSFKNIDMVGDIYGEDVALQLGFTNTTYTTTDSIHLSPGRIDIDGLTIRDQYGNTGRLDGWLTHKCFHEPEFTFNISNAENLLVYDVKENSEDRWYGRVFGNGSASIVGAPGFIDINLDMSTASGSTFTFVLSDAMQAYDYNFITFRDRDRALKDSLSTDPTPAVVRGLKARIAQSDTGLPTIYRMNLAVDVNTNSLVTLVMDPVGGDRIRAYGRGNLRMIYDSSNEDLRMLGQYTLSRGTYNFTLQDIIIKEFLIREGSSITFHGDPYAAQLGISASYGLNANLSDLDESFLQDKELKRTNVPVHALLNVTGDMRQPDISFDLEFPTLTQDVQRKVMSIISTDEMMNRQIIYLLALNRFYTPDYMSATKGNELVSVASSTISSQLSNMLGQLSDKWSISPNFRSDRGDFSDLEVDLALSSHLLNNRLLLNGNFGYRDKNLNSNSFIGDFDIEYLLNRAGSIRLKAYNRYNDRNYYLKSALTTQGVGVVFKRDFDSVFSFLRPFRRKVTSEPVDTAKVVPTDSVP